MSDKTVSEALSIVAENERQARASIGTTPAPSTLHIQPSAPPTIDDKFAAAASREQQARASLGPRRR